MLGGWKVLHEMNTIGRLKLSSSNKLKQWINHIQSFVIDGQPFSQSEVHSDYLSPLLDNMDEDNLTVERNSVEGDGNVDIIMKTLRNDVLDIIQDVDCHKKPSWIIYKLDTLENNIRESCHLQYAWMNHPVIREELLRAQEKYIVHLIEEIMDDVFQAWNNMKKRKKLGKERSINSVVSVLRILKKEVCRMLHVLNMTDKPCGENVFVDMKSKSFNDCLFQPTKPCLWNKNVQIHSQVTNEINLFGSKSFPLYAPKDNFHSISRNVHFEEAVISDEEDVIDIQEDVERQLLSVAEEVPPVPETEKIADSAEEIDLEDKLEVQPENDAYVFSQYAHETKCPLPRFIARLVPSSHKAKRSNSKSQSVINKESVESNKKTPTAFLDASTLTDEAGMSFQKSYTVHKDSECNTSRIFPCSIDVMPVVSSSSSYWNRTKNFSNRLYSNRRAWVASEKKPKCEESAMSHNSIKQCESLPAIELLRQQPSSQKDERKPRQNVIPLRELSQKIMNDLEVSVPENNSTESDSDESYFSCVPSETDFNFSSFFNKLKTSNLNKKSETNNFSCKSPKLGEIVAKKRKTRFKNSIVLPPEKDDSPCLNLKHDDFRTIAFLDEKPQKDIPSLTPEISNFSIDSLALKQEDKTVMVDRNCHEENMKQKNQQIPIYSYISDSQFSSLCLTANSFENLDVHAKHKRIDELIDAG